MLVLLSFSTFAQSVSKISGKIIDSKNAPIAGVTVSIAGSAKGASSDVEGRFTIVVPSATTVSLTVSAVGFQTKTLSDIKVAAGATEELNIILQESSKQLTTVVVTSTSARRESVNALISYQKNTNTVASVIVFYYLHIV